MQAQNFPEFVLVESADMNGVALNFYKDYSDFFKQIARTVPGDVPNGVVGATSFIATVVGSNVNVTGGCLFANYAPSGPSSDFPDYTFGSNINEADTVIPLADGYIYAYFEYDELTAERVVGDKDTMPPYPSVTVPIVRLLNVVVVYSTTDPVSVPTTWAPLWQVTGTTLTDLRNILYSSAAGTGDGQTIQVSSGVISAITAPGGLMSIGNVDQTVLGNKIFENNVGCSASAPTLPEHLTRKDYVDTAVTSTVTIITRTNVIHGGLGFLAAPPTGYSAEVAYVFTRLSSSVLVTAYCWYSQNVSNTTTSLNGAIIVDVLDESGIGLTSYNMLHGSGSGLYYTSGVGVADVFVAFGLPTTYTTSRIQFPFARTSSASTQITSQSASFIFSYTYTI